MPTENQIRILNALRRAAEAYATDADDTETDTGRGGGSDQHRANVVAALRQEAERTRRLAEQLTREYDAADVPTLDEQLADLVGAWKLASQETDE